MPLPPTDAPINDHAGVLSATTLARLDERLAHTRLIVVTVPTTAGAPIERLTAQLAAGRPVILLAVDDQRLCGHALGPTRGDALPEPVRAALVDADYDRAVTALVEATLEHTPPPPIASW